MPEKFDLDIKSFLTKYSVIAVAPSDDIFNPPLQRKIQSDENKINKITSTKIDQNVNMGENAPAAEPPVNFDKSALKIYKKIPTSGTCSIESLVADDMPLRVVIQGLLKLEMGCFVEMCPGELVRRKTN